MKNIPLILTFWSVALEIGLLDKTTLSIAVDKNNNIYYSTVLAGMYFLKNETKQIEKTNVFGTSVVITIDQNDNIFIKKKWRSFYFSSLWSTCCSTCSKTKRHFVCWKF